MHSIASTPTLTQCHAVGSTGVRLILVNLPLVSPLIVPTWRVLSTVKITITIKLLSLTIIGMHKEFLMSSTGLLQVEVKENWATVLTAKVLKGYTGSIKRKQSFFLGLYNSTQQTPVSVRRNFHHQCNIQLSAWRSGRAGKVVVL